MSVCVTIRTNKSVSPLAIRSRISTLHPRIVVPDCGETTMHFYVPGKSVRSVEVTKEADGYEVRITVNSSHDDWRIFRDLISQIIYLTDGKAYLEDDDESPVADVSTQFNDDDIERRIRDDYSLTKALAEKDSVSIFCINRMICVGEPLFTLAGINDSTPLGKAAELFEQYLLSVQWDREGHVSTETPICFTKVLDDNGEEQRVSAYVYSNANPDRYDYIHYEPFFFIYDADNKDGVTIEYENLHKIVPAKWTLFDREQYDCQPLTREEFDAFVQRARQYSYFENDTETGETSASETEVSKDLRHIHIDTDNTRIAVDVAAEAWVCKQGRTRLFVPKYIEYQLIYLLYRRKDRIAAARLLQKVFPVQVNVEEALNRFDEDHPRETMSHPFGVSDLEPLADGKNGLVLMSDWKKVPISAEKEAELLKLLKDKNVDGLIPWFENYLKANGYDLSPSEFHNQAINLSHCYLHYQSLDTDETDPLFGYDKKRVNKRFWVAMIAIAGITALFLFILSKISS